MSRRKHTQYTLACDMCDAIRSRSGKPFTLESLAQHKRAHERERNEISFPLTDMIADEDMPDGAYFALAHELGEW